MKAASRRKNTMNKEFELMDEIEEAVCTLKQSGKRTSTF
jgi:hypothetical protein